MAGTRDKRQKPALLTHEAQTPTMLLSHTCLCLPAPPKNHPHTPGKGLAWPIVPTVRGWGWQPLPLGTSHKECPVCSAAGRGLAGWEQLGRLARCIPVGDAQGCPVCRARGSQGSCPSGGAAGMAEHQTLAPGALAPGGGDPPPRGREALGPERPHVVQAALLLIISIHPAPTPARGENNRQSSPPFPCRPPHPRQLIERPK